MKKKLALLLAACLALAVVGCGSTAASSSAATPAFSETADSQTQPTPTADPEATPEATPEAEASSRILVAYFSCTGHTQAVAEQIAQRSNAKAIVTGENLGQVASQTMEAMASTQSA